MSTITFETIEKSVQNIDLPVMTAVADKASRAQRAIAVYRAVRPMLSAVAALPLLPPQFSAALRLFLVTFDAFVQSPPKPRPTPTSRRERTSEHAMKERRVGCVRSTAAPFPSRKLAAGRTRRRWRRCASGGGAGDNDTTRGPRERAPRFPASGCAAH